MKRSCFSTCSNPAAVYAGTALRIPTLPRIVGFRNRIIHGYDTIDDAAVWGIVQSHLPQLLSEVETLLREEGEDLAKLDGPSRSS